MHWDCLACPLEAPNIATALKACIQCTFTAGTMGHAAARASSGSNSSPGLVGDAAPLRWTLLSLPLISCRQHTATLATLKDWGKIVALPPSLPTCCPYRQLLTANNFEAVHFPLCQYLWLAIVTRPLAVRPFGQTEPVGARAARIKE